MAGMSHFLKVFITGDSKGAVKAFNETAVASERTGRQIDRTSRQTKAGFATMGESAHRVRGAIGSVAGAAGLGGLVFGIKDAVQAGVRFQDQQAQLQIALRNTGQYSAAAAKRIGEVVDASAMHGGFAVPEQMQAMTQLVRATGSATKATQDLGLATNIARGTHKDFLQVTKAVALAEQGRTTGFSRLGIVIPKVTAAQDALRLSTGKHTAAQLMAAKAADAQASKTSALTRLQALYGGATDRFGHTAAGALSNAKNAFEILSARIGLMLLPTITRLASFMVSDVMPALQSVAHWVKQNQGLVKFLAVTIGTAVAAWKLYSIAQKVANVLMAESPAGRVILMLSLLVAGILYVSKHFQQFRDATIQVFNDVKAVIAAVANWIADKFHRLTAIILAPFKAIGAVVHTLSNPGSALGAVGSFLGLARGGMVPGYATGGVIGGYGSGDTKLIRATPGEFMLRKQVVDAVGVRNLEQLNATGSMGQHIVVEATTTPIFFGNASARPIAELVTHYAARMTARR